MGLPAERILESSTDAFLAVDARWRVAYVNEAAQRLLPRLLGGVPSELVGRSLWEGVSGPAAALLRPELERALREQTPLSFEERFPDSDTWLEVHVFPAEDGLSIFLRDNTPLRQALETARLLARERSARADAEAARREAAVERREKERLRALLEALRDTPGNPLGALLEHAPVALRETDPAGRCRWVHGAWRQLADQRPEEALEFGWLAALHPEDREAVRAAFAAAAAGGEPFRLEYRVRAPEGGWRWLLDLETPRHAPSGELLGFVGVALDFTERRAAEEDLRQRAEQLAALNQRKDEFLAMVAHELRNPLASMLNAVEIMRARPDRARGERAREVLYRQVRHMARILDDLLDLSRVAEGKVALRMERVDLATVLERAIETALPALQARGHHFERRLPPEPVVLEADPTRLQQVFGNLLGNAAKYTEPGGRIELRAELEADPSPAGRPTVLVRVRDTGIGIAPELLPRVFDLFVQAPRARERSPDGLGIGLAMVRRLVELHGGSVEARSDGPGCGSEFLVRLPALPSATAAAEMAGDGRVCRLLPRRVLVVEDNVDAAETIRDLLELWGHTPYVAYDAAAALRIARETPLDAAILDIGLPGTDGYALARRLRELEGEGMPAGAARRLLLVALTGYGKEEDRRLALEAGFDRHLTKPVDPEALRELIALEESAGAA